jgi:predicted chitinase
MTVLDALGAAGVPGTVARSEAPLAERAMLEHGIETQPRAAMFLAQVLHESGALRYFEEIASGAAYEGRADLGNVEKGDGRRFKGRGPIQLTGRANYRWAGTALNLPLETHPELAERHDIGWRIAALYWQQRGLNALADKNEFVTITRRINGGTNGLQQRLQYYSVTRHCDCRPHEPDPLAHLTERERHWCREYDHLQRTNADPERRRVLRRVMRVQRKKIWRAAQDGGWDENNRAKRYRSLRARTR